MGAFLLQTEHFWCQALAVFAAGGDADLCKRAISFLYSSIWAWSEPFSRARSSMRCRRIETVVSDDFSRSDPRNISPFPVTNQSKFNSGKVSQIFDKTSLWIEVFLDTKRAIKPFETEIFCSNARVLSCRYSINCFNLSFIVSKIS